MGKSRRALVGVPFADRTAAERAAMILQSKRLTVDIVEVLSLVCPGGTRTQGWAVQVPTGDLRLAVRYLKEARLGA